MTSIRPYLFQVANEQIDDLKARIRASRWPDQLPGSGWRYGTDSTYLRTLAAHWADEYDWRGLEHRLASLPQFVAHIDEAQIQFLHIRSPRADARPLFLLHGWPSGNVEFLDLIDPLSDPESAVDPAFDLIVPSLPGFGFSGPTREAGWGPARSAKALAELMTALGYLRFAVHGGDFGAVIASHMARQQPDRVTTLHLTFLPAAVPKSTDPGLSPEESRLAAEHARYQSTEDGYVALQSTKPQTLAHALNDSPVGLAAWIVEKLHRWTDHDGDLEQALPRQYILDLLSVFWFTGTAGSAARMYYESRRDQLDQGVQSRIEVPTAVAVFPRDIYRTTRRLAEEHYRVVRWTEFAIGGHFPAIENAEDLISDLRESLGGGSNGISE